MSWLRSGSQNFSRRSQEISSSSTDSKAVLDSLINHWQQALEIINKTEAHQFSHDDVIAVVQHLDAMVTLLLVELHNCNKIALPNGHQPPAPCLEFMLSENLLDKLYEWSLKTGRYSNAVRLELYKLYELLVSHSRHQLLVNEPFLRPLLKLLASSQNEIFPHDVGKRLVILLNQLCVVLMGNVHLLDLFFCSTQQHSQHNEDGNQTNFIIFSLLIPYVHSDGSLGHQARDALLLCMSLSQKNANVGKYIAEHSSMSPVLVTGLCGLYSSLPNSIEVLSIDWFRITADDVNEIPSLTLFMNSLEFCNAVVQVAHQRIADQLLDFLYQGFLTPVLAPALLQTLKGSHFQTNVESQIAAMVYFDLILRSVTEPGLLNLMIKFLLDDQKFDGQRIIDVLIERLNSPDSKLVLTTLALFDTLLGLNNEQLMVELVIKHVKGAKHVPFAERHKINKIQSYTQTVDYFIDLAPEVMKNSKKIIADNSMDYQQPASMPNSSNVSKTIGADWNHFSTISSETLYSNYHAYLFDSHQKVKQKKQACNHWSENYFYKPSKMTSKENQSQISNNSIKKMIEAFLAEFMVESQSQLNSKQFDSLQSIGESSGYESLFSSGYDEMTEIVHQRSNDTDHLSQKIVEPWRISAREEKPVEIDLQNDTFAQGTVSLGPFLTSIWSKLQTYTSNLLYVNLHLTGIISHMVTFPLPLLHSIFLRPDIAMACDLPSFQQVLKILKQQIDAELPMTEESLEFIDNGRTFLIDREFRLINARKIALETLKSKQIIATTMSSTSSPLSPFDRKEPTRKSTGNPLMNLFRRPSTVSTASSQAAQGIANINTKDQSSSQEQPSSDSSRLGVNSYISERHRDLAILAVLLDEWLKELSAISQELSIVLLNENIKM